MTNNYSYNMKLTEKINSITNNLCFLNSLKDELSPKIKTFYDFQMSGMYFIKFTKLGSQQEVTAC